MLPCLDDTIVAIASAPGSSARGIVRLSGPRLIPCLEHFFVPAESWHTVRPVPQVLVGTAHLSPRLASIPCHVLYWPGRRSYTRQPAAEIHLPASRPLLDAALSAACRAGARLAQPGEFTLRAFLAGRLDLSQAEAVLGVIDAQNQRELTIALRQLAGGLGGPLQTVRDQLLDLLADVEAGLDFVEEDISFVSQAELLTRLVEAQRVVENLRHWLDRRTLVDGRFRVVLRGPPNAGKSSLFNALLGRTLALVSDKQGTTRDYLSAEVVWDCVPIELIDTAGVGDFQGTNVVDELAQTRTDEVAQTAHLVLYCHDATLPWPDSDADLPERLPSDNRIVVRTKSDLVPTGSSSCPGVLHVSSFTGQGLEELKAAIVARLTESVSVQLLPVTLARCRDAIEEASESLSRAVALAKSGHCEELVAGELRFALDALGRITGTVYTDDILDRIFSRFCIGK